MVINSLVATLFSEMVIELTIFLFGTEGYLLTRVMQSPERDAGPKPIENE